MSTAPTLSSVVPTSGDFEGGTRVHIGGQYLGTSLVDIIAVNFGENPCVDVHWNSASDIDCLSTNDIRNEGPVLVTMTTVVGGASVFGTQNVVFTFNKGDYFFCDLHVF